MLKPETSQLASHWELPGRYWPIQRNSPPEAEAVVAAGPSRPANTPYAFATAVNRTVAAQLAAAQGDTTRALSLLMWPESFPITDAHGPGHAVAMFNSYSMLARARLLEGQRETAEAARLYRQFLRRFDLADSSVVYLAREAQTQLAVLEGQKEQ